MIGATQRGELVGFKISEILSVPSRASARFLGKMAYNRMRRDNIAHIEPEEEFINGVVAGIASRQYLPQEKGISHVTTNGIGTLSAGS